MQKPYYVKSKAENKKKPDTVSYSVKKLSEQDLQHCKHLLEKDGEMYLDEDIELIYNYLSEMAELSVSQYLNRYYHEESSSNVPG